MRRVTCAVLLFVAFSAFGQEAQHTLTITGTGMAKAVPDRVSFSVGVSTTAGSVSEAFRLNNAKTQAVVSALKKAGVKDAEIQTTNFSVDQDRDPQSRKALPRFAVSNGVTVIREDRSAVSELLQRAIDAGANEAGQLNFFVADPSKARDEALARAVDDARARAEKIAAAAKRTLGAATMISTISLPSNNYYQNTVQEAITVNQGPAIEAGVSRIVETVTVTFELK